MLIYFLKIAKTNVILLSPVITYIILKKYSPDIFNRLKNNITGKGLHIKEAGFLSERFSDESLEFIKALSADMGSREKNNTIFLSDESRNSIKRIKKLLEKFPG